MIRPTIGRVVWYHPGPNDPTAIDATQPHAALIAHVENDRQVNLFVIDSEGGVYSRKSVRLAQDADKAESGGAQWMPFQTAQATADLPERVAVLEKIVKAMSTPAEPPPPQPSEKASKGPTYGTPGYDIGPLVPPYAAGKDIRNGKQKAS